MLHSGYTPPAIHSAVELRLLGTLSARVGAGREVGSLLAQPKRVALLAYLAAATPRGFHRRDTLLGLLWPDADHEHARASLRKAVHFLRQQLGPEVVVSRGEEEIGLGAEQCWCDVGAFEEAVEAGQWGQATELYQGDLLPGFHLSDVPEFDRWLEETRARLRDRAARAAGELADDEGVQGRRDGAVRWARWAVERAPYDENGIRRLLARLVEAGDRAGAVLAYEQFARRLSADLELQPSADTTALVDALRRTETPATSGPSRAPPSSLPKATLAAAAREQSPAELQRSSQPRRLAVLRTSMLLLGVSAVVVGLVLGLRSSAARPPTSLLAPRERLLIADFGSRTRDTTLGSVVTDAFRIDLAQSPSVSVVSPTHVTEVLSRMRLPGTTRLSPGLAREIALRDGIKAFVAGEIAAAGTQYVLSVSLVAANTGEVLMAHRETARDSTMIVSAVDRLSKALRERVGESLSTIHRDPPLSQATTSSLEALRKYSQAGRAINREGNAVKALGLYEDALALDSTFAAAYLGLASLLYNAFPDRLERIAWTLSKAFELRERLPTRERHLATTSYYSRVLLDFDKAIAAHRAMLDLYPEDAGILAALGVAYLETQQFAAAESVNARALAVDSSSYVFYLNLADVEMILGKSAEASATFERMVRAFPNNAEVEVWRAVYASMVGNYDAAPAHLQAYQELNSRSLNSRGWAGQMLGQIAAVRGRTAEAERQFRDAMAAAAGEGNPQRYHEYTQDLATYYLRVLRQPRRALRELERAMAAYPLDSVPPPDRRYVQLANLYALAGQPKRSRELLAEYERIVDPKIRRMADKERSPHAVWGELALAEGRLQDAIAEFRLAEGSGQCLLCGVEPLARAYAASGQTDSAIVKYERYVGTSWLLRIVLDASELATAYRQLGGLYELRGEPAKARGRYVRFVELWKQSDPELQPEVARVRRRLAVLEKEGVE